MNRRHPNADSPIVWHAVTWIAVVHFFGGVAFLYSWTHYSGATVVLALTWFLLSHLSISAGMHRLYSHRAYRAAKPLQVFFIFFSAAAFLSSVKLFVYQHRMHHWHSDTDKDPYSVKHGFWWAHWCWIWHTTAAIQTDAIKDLLQDKLIAWQDKYYFPLAILVALVFPMGIACLWHDPFGGLLVAGFLRLVVQYHSTWSINSVAHTFGVRQYGTAGTARLSHWLAVTSVGENNHERHHLAHEDYRLGTRWYHLDVGKWFIELCASLGLASGLRTISEDAVLARANRVASISGESRTSVAEKNMVKHESQSPFSRSKTDAIPGRIQ